MIFVRNLKLMVHNWIASRQAQQMSRTTALTPHEIHAERVRRAVAATLVFIAIVAFIEVVVAPGSMIRRHLRRTEKSATQPPASLVLHRQQLEQLRKEVEKEWEDFRNEFRSWLGVDLASATAQVPAASGTSPVAAAAWADIRSSAPSIDKTLIDSHAIIVATGVRLDAGKPVDTDERDILDATDHLQGIKQALKRMHAEIDHLQFQQNLMTQPTQ